MIEINLLPPDLKITQKKKSAIPAAGGRDMKVFLYIVPVIFIFLIGIHFYFSAVSFSKSGRLNALNNKLKSLEAQKKELEVFNKEFDNLSEEAKAIQQLTDQRLIFSEKLNQLSLNLPSGIWFNELAFKDKVFSLEGSALSFRKEEIGLIKDFVESLKKDKAFFKDFYNIELRLAQRRPLGAYDVVDFVLEGTLK